MTHTELIKRAASVINSQKLWDRVSGDVGCALITDAGTVYTGTNIDVPSQMGFCAETAAISAMVTAGEFHISSIVAVWKNEDSTVHILHPCGRCREFMRQINQDNLGANIILAKDRVVKLKELLPYDGDFSEA